MEVSDFSSMILEILVEFYDQVYADTMIGYVFHPFDKDKLTKAQHLFTMCMLKGVPYPGRPLGAVHRPLKIRKGQLLRRRVILSEILASSSLPLEFQKQWLRLEGKLEVQILMKAEPCG